MLHLTACHRDSFHRRILSDTPRLILAQFPENSPTRYIDESLAMYPKGFDSAPTSLGGVGHAQKLNGLALDEENGASDADSSTATESVAAHSEVSKGKKKKKRKARRGGMKRVKKATIMDSNADREGDSDADDERASIATTVLLDPSFEINPPLLNIANFEVRNPDPAPEVPVVAKFELRPISNTADNDSPNNEGLFATAEIKEGVRVISEPPLIALPTPGDDADAIFSAYQKLSLAEQDAFWTLRPAVPLNMEEWSAQCDALIPRILEIYEKDPADRTEEENNLFATVAPKVETMCCAWRVAARFHAHRYSLTNALYQDRSRIPADVPVTGLFVQAARLRHSCVPNCFCNWNAATGRMTVHAVKNIAAGEELTVSCIGTAAFYHTHSTRQAKLLDTAGLTCACPACDPAHADYKTHELVRARLHTLTCYLSGILTNLEVQDQDGNHVHEQYNPQVLTLIEMKVQDVITLLGKAGCADVEIVRWRNALRDRLLPRRGAWIAALAQAKLCVNRARICFGEDYPEMMVFEEQARFVVGVLERETEEEKVEGKGGKNKEEDK